MHDQGNLQNKAFDWSLLTVSHCESVMFTAGNMAGMELGQ